MSHLSQEQLSAHLDHAIAGRERERVAAHLAACERCRAALEAMSAQDRALEPALEYDPGEEYFERFSSRVTERLKAADARSSVPSAAQLTRPPSGSSWFGSPRRLALLGTVATVVVGGAIVLLTARQIELPTVANQRLMEPARARDASPSSRNQAGPQAGAEPHAGAPEVAAPPPLPSAGSEQGANQAPGTAAEPQATSENPSAGATLEAPRQGTAPGRAVTRLEARERAASGAVAPSTPAAGATPGAATPKLEAAKTGRAYEVRRDPVTGEEIAVGRESGFMPPRVVSAPVPAPASSGAVRVLKRAQTAQPMGSAPSEAAPGATVRGIASPPPAAGTLDKGGPVTTLDEKESAGGLLCGSLSDPSGHAVADAQVIVADVGITTRSDENGHFCLRAPAGRRTLSIMALGFAPVRRPVTIGEGVGEELALTLLPVAVLEGERSGMLRVADSISKRIAPMYRGGATGSPGTDAPGFSIGPAVGSTGAAGEKGPALTPAKDVFAALPDTLQAIVRQAERYGASAASRHSASDYDFAAAAWENLLRQVQGGPAENETRFRLAETRFRAWETSPGKRRASAAIEALTAYVVRAPGGAQRRQAARWLDQVK